MPNFVYGVLVNMETRSRCTGDRIEMFETILQSLFWRILLANGITPTEVILTGHWRCSNSIPAHEKKAPPPLWKLVKKQGAISRCLTKCEHTDCNGSAHYNNPRSTPDMANFCSDTVLERHRNNLRKNYVNRTILRPQYN